MGGFCTWILKVILDDFIFDNQMLAQIILKGYIISEVSCPTKYFPEASSINFIQSVKYGCGCLLTALQFRLAELSIMNPKIFSLKRADGL